MTDSLGDKLDRYFALYEEVHKAFGYVEDWVVIPMDDRRDDYWHLSGEGRGDEVAYSPSQQTIRRYLDSDGEDIGTVDDKPEDALYSSQIYTQRFLPKWVYRADDFTMISVDTMTDGNKFLMIFDNAKEVTA